MKQNKFYYLIVIVVLACFVSLSFIYASGTEEEKVPEEVPKVVPGFADANINWKQLSGEKISLLLVAHPWQEGLSSFIHEFEELTDIKVEIEVISETLFWDKVVMALQAKETPFDAFYLAPGFDTFAYYQNGWLQSVEPYLNDPTLTDKKWYNLEGLNKASVDFFRMPDQYGELFGLPITYEPNIIQYRTDIFEELGIDATQLQTIDDWLEVVKKIKAGTEIYGAVVRGGALGLIDELNGMLYDYWGDLPYTFGHQMFFDENWCPRFTHPRIRKGFETWAELMKYSPPGVTSYSWYDATNAFKLGLAGTFWFDSNMFGTLSEDQETSLIAGKVGYAPCPKTEYGHMTTFWSWGMGIPTKIPENRKKAAWLLLEWATSKIMDFKIGLKTWVPVRKDSLSSPDYLNIVPPGFAEASLASMDIAVPSLIYLPVSEEVTKAIIVALHDIYGGMDSIAAMEKLQKEAIKILEDGDIIKTGQCKP